MPLMITSDRRLSKVAQLLNAAHRGEPAKHIMYSDVVKYMSDTSPTGLGLLEAVNNGIGDSSYKKADGTYGDLQHKRLQVKANVEGNVNGELCYNSEWDCYPIIMVTPSLLQKLENKFFK